MDFANDIDESFAHARPSPRDQQNRDEAKRLQDDVLGAIERLERQTLPLAIARPIRPSAFDRADVAERISNLRFSRTSSPSSSWKVLRIRVIVGVVAAAFAIGVVSIAAHTGRLALPDVPVIRSFAWFAGAPSDTGAEETVPTRVQQATTAPPPATLPAQIPAIAESNGAPSDQVSAPAETAPANVASIEATEHAQPSTAIAEHEPIDPPKDDKKASLPIDPNVSVPVTPQQNVSSPATTLPEDHAALFHEFLEWRTDQAKPQLGEKRQAASSKRVKGLHVLRSNRRGASDPAVTTTNSSLRTRNGVGHHDPARPKQTERRS
jgi:hypothetical protein